MFRGRLHKTFSSFSQMWILMGLSFWNWKVKFGHVCLQVHVTLIMWTTFWFLKVKNKQRLYLKFSPKSELALGNHPKLIVSLNDTWKVGQKEASCYAKWRKLYPKIFPKYLFVGVFLFVSVFSGKGRILWEITSWLISLGTLWIPSKCLNCVSLQWR